MVTPGAGPETSGFIDSFGATCMAPRRTGFFPPISHHEGATPVNDLAARAVTCRSAHARNHRLRFSTSPMSPNPDRCTVPPRVTTMDVARSVCPSG